MTKRPHSPKKERAELAVKENVVEQVEESDSDDDGDFGPLPAEDSDAISAKRRKRVRGIPRLSRF